MTSFSDRSCACHIGKGLLKDRRLVNSACPLEGIEKMCGKNPKGRNSLLETQGKIGYKQEIQEETSQHQQIN